MYLAVQSLEIQPRGVRKNPNPRILKDDAHGNPSLEISGNLNRESHKVVETEAWNLPEKKWMQG
jgi:hypothetical protein